MKMENVEQNRLYLIILILITGLIVTLIWAYDKNQISSRYDAIISTNYNVNSDEDFNIEDHYITPLDTEAASNSQTTADDLAFIIEEEKLAHDVYYMMYDLWSVKIFDNIKDSESTHQNLVLAVMKSRNLDDPRSAEIGIFNNEELQSLYNELIEKGSLSKQDAFEVGVLIEETDIADLQRIINNLDPIDIDISDVLASLLSGSENHLRSFNRQADR